MSSSRGPLDKKEERINAVVQSVCGRIPGNRLGHRPQVHLRFHPIVDDHLDERHLLATGVRIGQLPVKPEEILRGLGKKAVEN